MLHTRRHILYLPDNLGMSLIEGGKISFNDTRVGVSGMNLVKEDTNATIEMLLYRLQQAVANCDTQLELATHYPPIPPFETDINGDLVQTLSKCSGKAPGTVAFGTEGHFLQSLGMETVIFGAGSIDQAHQPDEFIELAQIEQSILMYRQLINKICAE